MNEPGAFSTWLTANSNILILWIGTICTLGLYSVLYKENKVFRFFEHLFLGLATGYMIATTWNDVLLPKWWKPFYESGQWWWVFALVVGMLYYLIYSKKNSWYARMVIGLFLGVGAGQQFQIFVNDVWPQIYKSFKPVIPHPLIIATADHPAIKAVPAADAINNLIFMLILLCVMSYFFFSFELKNKALKGSATMGRWLMMFTFGAIFGQTIMGRLALLIDRMDYLMNDFGGAVLGGPNKGPTVMFAILMSLTGLVLFLALRKQPPAAGDTESAATSE